MRRIIDEFTCDYCGKIFIDRKLTNQHKINCGVKSEANCNICKYNFNGIYELEAHSSILISLCLIKLDTLKKIKHKCRFYEPPNQNDIIEFKNNKIVGSDVISVIDQQLEELDMEEPMEYNLSKITSMEEFTYRLNLGFLLKSVGFAALVLGGNEIHAKTNSAYVKKEPLELFEEYILFQPNSLSEFCIDGYSREDTIKVILELASNYKMDIYKRLDFNGEYILKKLYYLTKSISNNYPQLIKQATENQINALSANVFLADYKEILFNTENNPENKEMKFDKSVIADFENLMIAKYPDIKNRILQSYYEKLKMKQYDCI